MSKEIIETPWGDFEELEELEETTVDSTEEEIEDTPEDKSEDVEETEETEEQEEEEIVPETVEKDPKEAEEIEDPVLNAFESITSSLEEEELIFLGSDKQYDATPEGFKSMLEDNMLAYKDKLESSFQERETKIRQEYEKSSAPKFSEMDPSDEDDAMNLLQEYYLDTGFTEEEAEEKLLEVKELDNYEKEAVIAQRYLSKKEKTAEANEAQKQADLEIERQAQVDNYIMSIKSQIDETEEMSGFKLSNKMRKDFKDYLFKADKSGETAAQKAGKDPNRRLRLAFLDFVDYNKKDFEIKAKTALANDYEKKASRFTNKQSNIKGKSMREKEQQEGLQEGFLDFWNSK